MKSEKCLQPREAVSASDAMDDREIVDVMARIQADPDLLDEAIRDALADPCFSSPAERGNAFTMLLCYWDPAAMVDLLHQAVARHAEEVVAMRPRLADVDDIEHKQYERLDS